jgi:multidrug efflux system membrane fusion protein
MDSPEEVRVSLKNNIGLLLLLVGMSEMLTSCSRVAAKTKPDTGAAVPVRAVKAVTRDVPLEIAAVGNVEAMESVEVKSRVAGQVRRVAFQEGQSVAKGQLLFTIDPDGLQRQAAEQRAELVRDAAMEKQARAIVTRDEVAQKQSHADAQIAIQLGKLGVISGQRVDQLVTARDMASAGLSSDGAAAEASGAARKTDEARLAETELQLSFTNVLAPEAGRAGAAMVKGGNIVRNDDTTLVTLLRLTPIYVTFGIPEQMLPEVQQFNAQSPLAVEVNYGNGLPRQGHLAFIDNTVDSASGMIRLKAVFPNSDSALWPGEFVHIHLRLRIDPTRVIIPYASIHDGINGKYVWLVQSGRARMTHVTVARTWAPENGPELAVIGGGLRPGDMVVTEGGLRLTAGVPVFLLNAPRESTKEPADADTSPAP